MGEREFNTGEPLAYFLTWTTYGTWLPGDERGWKRRDCLDIQLPNPFLLDAAGAQMKETAFDLSLTDRQVIEEVIGRHCEIRHWHLYMPSTLARITFTSWLHRCWGLTRMALKSS